MDSPPKKRRFWQLHLSTAVLLMLAAGGILWIETRERFVKAAYDLEGDELKNYAKARFSDSPPRWISKSLVTRGWPLWFYGYYELEATWITHFNAIGLVIDSLVSIAFLLIVGFSLEWRIRRREGRKP
jgi:hypothetical protein